MLRRKITVTGIVQNVGYRWFTKNVADALKIKGFCKNQINGSVLIEAQGSMLAMEAFQQKLKDGPTPAEVETIIVEDIALVSDEEIFTIIR